MKKILTWGKSDLSVTPTTGWFPYLIKKNYLIFPSPQLFTTFCLLKNVKFGNKENRTLLLIMMQSFEFVCWDWPCSVGISWTLVVCVGKPWIHWTFNSIPIPAISKLWQGRSWNCKTRIEASPKCKTSPCVRVHTCVTWIWAGVGVSLDGHYIEVVGHGKKAWLVIWLNFKCTDLCVFF